MGAHNLHYHLYQFAKGLADPGDGGTIFVNRDLAICELVTTAAETRTLLSPTKPGIRFVLRMLTDGGDAVVTASNGLNQTGNTTATFADTSDLLEVISVTHTSGYRWEILKNLGSVALA